MPKYRMLTSGPHNELTAADFRAFGPFNDPDGTKRTLWVCECPEGRDYSAEELRPLSADTDGNWMTAVTGALWRVYGKQ